MLKITTIVILLVLGGCAKGWLADWTPSGQGDHSRTYRDGTTYFYGRPTDSRHSVEKYRPDLWNRMFARPPAR